MVAFPFAAQYRPEYLQHDRDDVHRPLRKLAELCQRNRAPLLDLFEQLAPTTDMEPDGIHLSSAARAKVGAFPARFVTEFAPQAQTPAGE